MQNGGDDNHLVADGVARAIAIRTYSIFIHHVFVLRIQLFVPGAIANVG